MNKATKKFLEDVFGPRCPCCGVLIGLEMAKAARKVKKDGKRIQEGG